MLSAILGGSIIMVGSFIAALITSSRVNLSDINLAKLQSNQVIPGVGNALGDPNAPVLIEEYSDFACSHCADFALETKKILEDSYLQSNQVQLIYYSVGGLLGSDTSVQAAEAAYCAGDQDAFWPYHDLIFANQIELFQNPAVDITLALFQIAEALELDQEQFAACLSESKYQEQVAQDELNARQRGVTGTPSFFINGVMLRGNQPLEVFQQMIEEELDKAGE
jgi:protein-disulfide isomerase